MGRGRAFDNKQAMVQKAVQLALINWLLGTARMDDLNLANIDGVE